MTYLDPRMHTALRQHAKEQGITLQAVVVQALERRLDDGPR